VAARAYITSDRSDDEWISSHLELRGTSNEILSGYGWIFPLGSGQVNIGVGTLATAKHPADLNLRALMDQYTEQQRDTWQLDGELAMSASAMLPMGGAVSGVSGRNWMLVGDAAGCVNPLNGEGIDYGLETGRLAVDMLDATHDYTQAWSSYLREHYGVAFSIARRLAGYLTIPRLLPTLGPIGMRSHALMTVALRVMGNLVTEEDSDFVARMWRASGRASMRADARPPFS
jgi:flavin-dependent dehydrogenase